MKEDMIKPSEKTDSKALKEIVEQFFMAWKEKVKEQGEVFIFSDFSLQQAFQLFYTNMDYIPWDEDLETLIKGMELFADRRNIEGIIAQMVHWHYGRYVDYELRRHPKLGTSGTQALPDFLKRSDQDRSFSLSQGRFHSLKWKDTILFKTAFDLGIYQMLLWELKPRTIIEIGAGAGGSAIWMADLMRAYREDCRIISLDIVPPNISYDNVEFIEGDCNDISEALEPERLGRLPHPWLLIEDAHVNVLEVLSYFHNYLQPGDYLIVEDSNKKQDIIAHFLQHRSNCYKVDSRYCDFFGYNMTCSVNSIFLRV